MLRVLRGSTDKASSRITIQKLVHTYPSDVWTLATLASLLEQTPDIKMKYQQLVLIHSEYGSLSKDRGGTDHSLVYSNCTWSTAL